MGLSSTLELREEVEIVHGMDDIPLIYDPATGNYHRITRAGERVLAELNGTRTRSELIEYLTQGHSGADRAKAELDGFLTSLEKSGLLVGCEPARDNRASGRFRTSMLMPRFVVSRSLPVLLEPPARILRPLPLKAVSAAVGAGAVLGFSLGVYTVLTSIPPVTQLLVPAFALAALLQFTAMLLHETSHALVAQVLRVPVRGMGVALLFYFMPLAYVDRTDAYRLRARGGRVALALAGIASDGLITGAAAIVALNTDGLVQHTAAFLLILQLVGLVVNTNPLLPSDGYAALEAASGLLEARGRSFTVLGRTLTRRPLPPHLARLSARARLAHLLYAAVSTAYVGVLAVAMLSTVLWSVEVAGTVASRW